MVPARFNMARYCLDQHPAAKIGLIVAGAHDDERWTYGALKDATLRVAQGLLSLGLVPGDRLMIRMDNDTAYALAYFGAIAAGIVALPSSAQLTAAEAGFLLADSGARAIAVGDSLADVAVPDGVMSISAQAIRAMAKDGPLGDFADTAADDPAFLVYTSGTTGKPKGVLHGQRHAWGRRPMYKGWYGIGASDVVLHAGAFNWTYTLGVGLTDPWANGATACLYNGPRDAHVWPRLIERFRATIFATVPGLYRQILKYGTPEAFDLSSLRHGLTAGEALAPSVLEAWRQTVGTELYEALGMSEISTYISQSPPGPARAGSPGRPQPGRKVAILDQVTGAPLGPDEIGLLAVHRSDPGLMLGYWNRPDEQAQVLRGDWFAGGDLAHLDGHGYIWFHGRNDDLMNAGGYRVSPLEVEAALAGHPAVAEVAVAERRVSDALSVICAYVVARDSATIDKAALIDFAGERLAAYKRPKDVVVVDSLPRTANGKVMRRALAARP
ncbi:AMP-dependent synthetase [Oleomonas cavernae]|uniref:AMP-dependent synthetase n=1 Tax=Oleomonas cavernae TaxID=2320859 RepID=A0A418WBG1_9PROT|nr:acyl-CoA synthetase [Oleomonas cavernae]RJF87345.1 AMP-dependent synthetase [Oleomonas cavernae]